MSFVFPKKFYSADGWRKIRNNVMNPIILVRVCQKCEKEKNKMTNREWLLNKMQNMSDEELEEIVSVDCANWEPAYKKCGRRNCRDCQKEWLKAEHKEKITLSEAERTILENIDKDYKWITRDICGAIFIHNSKPKKEYDAWWNESNIRMPFGAYNNLFQFIKWEDEEAYNLEELLKQ